MDGRDVEEETHSVEAQSIFPSPRNQLADEFGDVLKGLQSHNMELDGGVIENNSQESLTPSNLSLSMENDLDAEQTDAEVGAPMPVFDGIAKYDGAIDVELNSESSDAAHNGEEQKDEVATLPNFQDPRDDEKLGHDTSSISAPHTEEAQLDDVNVSILGTESVIMETELSNLGATFEESDETRGAAIQDDRPAVASPLSSSPGIFSESSEPIGSEGVHEEENPSEEVPDKEAPMQNPLTLEIGDLPVVHGSPSPNEVEQAPLEVESISSSENEETIAPAPSSSPPNEETILRFDPASSPRNVDVDATSGGTVANDDLQTQLQLLSSANSTLRKMLSAEGASGGLKRPQSAARLELSSAKEDTIRALLGRGVDLEQEFLRIFSSPDWRQDAQLLQHYLAAGGTAKMLGALMQKLVQMYRSEDDEDFAVLPKIIRSARMGISVRSRGPSKMFCFSAKDTCIEISGTSTFAKSFPSTWGVSLWLWISPKCIPFTVASFLTKERYGVSVTLVPPDDQEGRAATLLFESADEKKRDGLRVTIPMGQLKCRTWHHLYICHSRKKSGSSSGSVVIRIDDRMIEEKPLGFPGLGLTSPVTRARLMEDFDGLSGPLWVLDGPLKSSASLARHQVTPILAEGEEAAPGLGVFVTRADQEPYPSVFASYHPERTVGKLCLDLHGSHLGTLMNSCVPWCVLSARDSLRSAGGPIALLPFLQDAAQLGNKRDPAVVAEVVLQTLLLLSSLLEGHTPNQNDFYEVYGVSVMTHALENLPRPVKEEMLRDPSRDLVSALGSVARAFGLDAIGTSSEGTRLMRMMNWRPRSVEYELDRQLILNLDFWIRFTGSVSKSLLTRVVALAAKRVGERPLAYRKRFGTRFFMDMLRRLYENGCDDGTGEEVQKVLRGVGSAFVDSVVAPMFTDASAPVVKEEIRALLDACIGAGHGSSSSGSHDPLRDRRRTAAWDSPTMELAHDALRLLVRLYHYPANHVVLGAMNIPSILAVEVVAFGGLGERIRALALRAIGLGLASAPIRDASDQFASIGGFSYLSSALSYALAKGEKRFAAGRAASGSFDEMGGTSSGSSSALSSPKFQTPSHLAQQQQPRKSLTSTFASSKPFFLGSSPPGSSASLRRGSTKDSINPATPSPAMKGFSGDSGPLAASSRSFLPADVAVANVVSSVTASAHVSDATYNSLMAMVVTSSSIANCANSPEWKRLVQTSLSDEDDFDPSLPGTVLDDVMRIANVHALSVVLDQLGHMSPLVQQRTFQDLFVLLKFEPENRKAFCSIPNWQRTLAGFLSSSMIGEKIGVFEMGVKLWVLVLHDSVLKEPETMTDVYWLGESFGRQVSEAVLSGLLESFKSIPSAPPAAVIESLVKTAELSPQHYSQVLQLIDGWKKLPELPGPYFALVIKETGRVIAQEQTDLPKAVKSAKRAFRLLGSVSSSLAHSSTFGGENLFRDAAMCAVVRVHECLERFQGKTDFASQEEKDFLDNCALTLVEAARILSSQAQKDSRSEMELIELASALMPNRGKPMPREAWLHSRWAMNPLEPGFASLSDATLDDLSFTVKRTDRERSETKFAKAQEKLSSLAKTRADLESSVRESEERFVYAELARLTSATLSLMNERSAIVERWRTLMKEMECGETVWKNGQLATHWMCPDREDHLRRHLVMEKNLNGVSHQDAAYESSLQSAGSNNGSSSGGDTASSYNPPKLPLPVTSDPLKDAEVEESSKSLLQRKREATFPFDTKEEICYVAEGARWVTPSIVVGGRVEVSAHHVMFYAADLPEGSSAYDEQKRKHAKRRERWRLDELVEIHSRRYLLRPTAIELFFSDRTTAFFAFPSQAIRDECSAQILKQKPARLEKAFTGSLAPPAQVFKRSRLTEMWRRREISNFEYLMRLNTIAGRTYNDVTQFFVFPWILTDYESAEINLDDHSKFRDLSKPVGALNQDREAEVRERYSAFTEQDMGMPPFHHGSHYSSAGVVLHYLIRVEPYTTLAIELQGGRFDVPDRLFHSIKDCFRSCYSSVVDCRELIPEFFYLSEMFVNQSKLPLGKRQDGNLVDDVRLPAWAENDPERFVRMNRESLESEYVSESLHNWIDLIFGYKQRGKDAVDACNVFNHLSYEGAVDLDAISDPGRRAAIELQILEFGQCPSQLLTHPHPKRMSLNELGRSIALDLVREAFFSKSAHYKWNMLVWRKMAWQASVDAMVISGSAAAATVAQVPGAVVSGVVATAWTPVKQVVRLFGGGGSSASSSKPQILGASSSRPPTSPTTTTTVIPPPVVSLTAFQDRVVVVHADMTATVLHIVETSDSASLEFRPGMQTVLSSAQASTYVTTRPRDIGLVGTTLGQSLRGRPHDFVASQGGNLMISSPYFDGSIRCFRMDGTRIESNVVGHRGRVSALAQDGRWLVSGSADGTAVLWKVGGSHDSRDEILEMFGEGQSKAEKGERYGQLLKIERFLVGCHLAPITSVAVSQLVGVIVTGAQDGSLIVHALYDRSPAKMRRLETGWKTPVDLIAISSGSGGVVAHSKAAMELVFFSVNGQLLGRVSSEEPWNFCEIVSFHEQDVVIGGGDKSGEICVRRTPDLEVTRKISYAKRYRGVQCAGVSPGGKYIFVGCADGSVIALGDGTGLQMESTGATAEGGKKGMVVSE